MKSTHLPIMKNILEKITTQPTKSLEDLNIDIAFKIAWAGFLCPGKIIYTTSKLKKKFTFVEIYTIWSNILFPKGDKYAVFRLKCSKIDINHSKV